MVSHPPLLVTSNIVQHGQDEKTKANDYDDGSDDYGQYESDDMKIMIY